MADTSGHSPDEHLDQTGWREFIAAEIANTLHVYKTKPKILLSQARDERQIAGDYARRELLELVQNAADAAAEQGGKGRIRIDIGPKGLIVANTGQPFRASGVESLMTPHASDKPSRQAKLIGAKGLGFRALLNWSHEPIISSGNLEIGFSERHAAVFIEELAEEVPAIARILQQEDELPVPILAFPAYGGDMDSLGRSTHADLVQRVRALRASGFDTVVAAPFESKEALGLAEEQADEFEPTFLLFVDALDEIELNVASRPTARWRRRQVTNNTYRISVEHGDEITEQTWISFRRRGELAARGHKRMRGYEMAVAFRSDQPSEQGFLHSYFPTNIPVPLPALFHATFELGSDRKSIKDDSELNERVLAELAAFYAACLSHLLKGKQIGNALDFISRAAPFPQSLEKFEQAIYREIKPLPVIPTMRGRLVRVAEAKLGPDEYQSYLPARLFGYLAKCRNVGDRAVLGRLGIETLSADGIVQSLRKAELSLEERARAIAGIAINLDKKYHDRRLFLDQNGHPIRAINTLFPPPINGENLPTLPDWAKARFIHSTLWKLILRKAEGPTPREKLRGLSGFGISEYSNESVIASLRSQASHALLKGRRDPDLVQRELLRAMHQLYSPDHRNPPGIFRVRCMDGIWRDTRDVHLSETFGRAGTINTALFRHAPAFLLAPATDNGLEGDPANRAAFFQWIGVHAWPKEETVPVPADQHETVKRALPDEITVEDGSSHQTFNKSEISWGYNFEAQYSSIILLKEILAAAESDAILAWLAYDPRFDLSAPYRFATTASGRKDGKAKFRPYSGELPDLVRERIAATPWLACRDEKSHPPRDAMVEPGSLAELFHVPRPAAIGSEERLGLTQFIWRRGLDHAQVPRSLSDLTEARVFTLLRMLPERSPSEVAVRALYTQVLSLDPFDPDKAPNERSDFLKHGRVQTHKARRREWVSPSEALYADQTGFPAAARETLALIDLPARRSTGNVLQRFGVAALSQTRFKLAISRLVEETGFIAAALRADLAAARPFIRALRLADSNTTPRLRRFEQLTLKVASSAEISVTVGDQQIPGMLDAWSHVLNDQTLIVSIDVRQDLPQITALAHEAIADGIAQFFDLQSGADFAKLLSARNDGLRRMLLRRMLANLSDTEIDALLQNIPAPDEPYIPVMIDPEVLARGPVPLPIGEPGASPPASAVAPPHDLSRPNNPNAVLAKPIAPGPTAQPWTAAHRTPVALRIARATTPLGTSTHVDPHRPADAEEWTKLFEISQGRFPLPVSHLQGRDSFGCDWLSFASETHLATFLKEPSRLELIARFIETKSGAIELSDTQSRAAERQKARFFIYRIQFYSGQRDTAELTIASDPLAHRQALSARYEFRIDAVENRETYQLTPDYSDPDEAKPVDQ